MKDIELDMTEVSWNPEALFTDTESDVIDLNRLPVVTWEQKDVSRSKYLLDEVPYANYLGVDMYFVPVDGIRIYDPLFYCKACIIGQVVAVHLDQNPEGVYNRATRSGNSLRYSRIERSCIIPCVTNHIYSDGKCAYITWHDDLVKIESMIISDPKNLNVKQYATFYKFANGIFPIQTYEKEIKPNLKPRRLLPVIGDQVADELSKCRKKLEQVETELVTLKEREKQISHELTELQGIMVNHPV